MDLVSDSEWIYHHDLEKIRRGAFPFLRLAAYKDASAPRPKWQLRQPSDVGHFIPISSSNIHVG